MFTGLRTHIARSVASAGVVPGKMPAGTVAVLGTRHGRDHVSGRQVRAESGIRAGVPVAGRASPALLGNARAAGAHGIVRHHSGAARPFGSGWGLDVPHRGAATASPSYLLPDESRRIADLTFQPSGHAYEEMMGARKREGQRRDLHTAMERLIGTVVVGDPNADRLLMDKLRDAVIAYVRCLKSNDDAGIRLVDGLSAKAGNGEPEGRGLDRDDVLSFLRLGAGRLVRNPSICWASEACFSRMRNAGHDGSADGRAMLFSTGGGVLHALRQCLNGRNEHFWRPLLAETAPKGMEDDVKPSKPLFDAYIVRELGADWSSRLFAGREARTSFGQLAGEYDDARVALVDRIRTFASAGDQNRFVFVLTTEIMPSWSEITGRAEIASRFVEDNFTMGPIRQALSDAAPALFEIVRTHDSPAAIEHACRSLVQNRWPAGAS